MTQKELTKRVERFTRVAKLVAILVFLSYGWYIVSTVYLTAVGRLRLENPWPGFLLTGFALAILVLAFRVVFSLRADASPFTGANAKRLRWIGLLLIVYEPLQGALSSRLTASLAGELSTEGTQVSVHVSLGGLLIVVGLAILAISFVFEYGAQLQKLSDETL